MTVDRKIKQIFSKLLGAEIELEPLSGIPQEYSEKSLFLDIINYWILVWNRGNILVEDYGINFQGYDDLFYCALEDLLLLKYGEIKYKIITSYIYSDIISENNALLISDKNNKKYEIKTVEELWNLIQTINDEDFYLTDEEEK